MTTTIRLDTNAMNALFPEGSQARVELQQCVIAEFTRKHLKPSTIGSDIHRLILAAKQEAIKGALEELGCKVGPITGSVTLSAKLTQEIRKTASDSVRSLTLDAVTEIKPTIQDHANRAVNAILEREIIEAIRKRIEAVKAQLGAM